MEIELRGFIEDPASVEVTLKKLSALKVSEEDIVDLWFCPSSMMSFEQAQMHKVGSYSLRIRMTAAGAQLNCKVLEKEGDHNAFHEFETKVDNPGEMETILTCLGFKLFCTVDKHRTSYRIGVCTVNLEDIKGYRHAVELEIIADKDVEKHKAYMADLLTRIGVKPADRIEKSITYLYMQEFSFR